MSRSSSLVALVTGGPHGPGSTLAPVGEGKGPLVPISGKTPPDSGSEGGSSEQMAHEAASLLFAVSRGKIKAVIKFLASGVDVNSRDYDGTTALAVAAKTGSMELLHLLAEKGADVNSKDRWGHTPLDEAIASGHNAAAEFLRTLGGVESKPKDPPKESPLDPQSSVALLLHYAAAGDVERVRKLLESGEVTTESADYDYRRAANLAASEGRLEILKLLAERGANFNAVDRWGNRCLDDAIRGSHLECADFLRSKGALEGETDDTKPFTLKQASAEAMAELHRRGVREFWALHQDDFEIEAEPFAKGAGGEVFHARWRDLECVAKTCGKLSATEQTLTDLGNEIALMATIRHPHIVLFFGACFQVTPPVLLLEYCSGGNLETKIIRAYSENPGPKDRLNAARKLRYAHELALGMTFLHKCTVPIIHRDLKPSNVLLSAEDTVKISDFGLAKYVPSKNKALTDSFKLTGETGSYRYMSPEVFKHQPYNQSVDVYSYALIIYYLVSGARPFINISDPVKAVKYAALEGGRPALGAIKDKRVAALLEKAWAQNPDDRPSFSVIAKFFEELRDQKQPEGGCVVG